MVVQPNGKGALATGGYPGNKGGTGRPRDRIRRQAVESLEERLKIANEIIDDGEAKDRDRIMGLAFLAKVGGMEQKGGITVDAELLNEFFTVIELYVDVEATYSCLHKQVIRLPTYLRGCLTHLDSSLLPLVAEVERTARLEVDQYVLDGSIAAVGGIVCFAQVDAFPPASRAALGIRNGLARTPTNGPFAAPHMDENLVSRVGMDSLPLTWLGNEPLHDDAIVVEEHLGRDFGIDLTDGVARRWIARLQSDPDEVDWCISDVAGLVLLGQVDGLHPSDRAILRRLSHPGHLAATPPSGPKATFDAHRDLISRMGVNPLPLPRLDDEPLHDDVLVFEQQLSGDVGVEHPHLLRNDTDPGYSGDHGGKHRTAEKARSCAGPRTAPRVTRVPLLEASSR